MNPVQINSSPFEFPKQRNGQPMKIQYPMSPLVTYKEDVVDGQTTIYVRIVAFIDSLITDAPTLNFISLINNQLKLEIDYNHKGAVPTSFNAWFIDYNYPVASGSSVDSVLTCVQNEDPTTSRGTVTTAQVQL